jgi:DNA-binding NarL/FixJ family response regulator
MPDRLDPAYDSLLLRLKFGRSAIDPTAFSGLTVGELKPERAMKALLADDHVIFRQGLRALIESIDPDASFLEAGSYTSALDVGKDCDDLTIIVVDLRMPGAEGVDGLRALRRRFPTVPVFVLSASEDAEDVFQALQAGASGYLAKSAPAETVIEALRVVLVGGIYVPRSLVAVRDLATPEPIKQPSSEDNNLTPRQYEVLQLLAGGCSNKEIAGRLGTSEGTVKAHVSAIMRQLGVRNRVQLLLAAQDRGFTAEQDR